MPETPDKVFPVDPLHQFQIHSIVPVNVGGVDLSFTNSALWMAIAIGLIGLFFVLATGGRQLVPGRLQSVAELMYEIVANMVRDNVGTEGRRYFPFVFTLFMFTLFGNVLGIIPHSFTYTSHIIVTFFMAFVIFIAVTVIGFARHGLGFLRLFFPHGAPLWTSVILVPIELISYLSRPVSLSVRLFANMMAGHIMLKVFAGFVLLMGLAGVVPLAALVGITVLELLVAVLQAYIFTILTCVYLHDAIHLH
ncbi:F0F1 ATP synthase subunit A [Tistlia consotensis]|uniref:F0F1 ATP synthase subunit A n=1 Tax=Tistlia consotensis TaxID=1321365 RepID=UPI00190ED55C|nr:F0F1 ATP synthase subunit A [Tistlia consotensis]